MGVFQRIKDMTKASIHDMLDRVEDPIVMLNQYLRDMEEEIAQAEVTVAKQLAHERRMLQKVGETKRRRDDSEQKAEQLIRSGQEEAAREALEEKLYYDEKLAEYEDMYKTAKEQADDLQSQLHEMKDEFYKMRNKRNELKARARMASAQKQMSEISSVHTLESGHASKGFHRMEEKIMEMEIEADLGRKPYRAGRTEGAASDPAKEARIDEQMEALKEKVKQASQ